MIYYTFSENTMKVLTVLIAFFAVAKNDNAPPSDPRIIGGYIVTNITQFPYQVSLRDKYGHHFCGGSIISETYVVTAAHCVDKKKSKDILVAMGTLDVFRPTRLMKVDKIKKHEKYNNKDDLSNDVAVLRLKGSIEMKPTMKSIDLWNNQTLTNNCVVSGWGTADDGQPSRQLRAVNVSIHDFARCQNIFEKAIILPGMLCAGPLQGGKDACQGDSGGPLTCGNVLVGIVSWGYGCAQPGLAGVYTDVHHYYSWIKKKSGSRRYESSITLLILMLFLMLNVIC